MHAKRKLLGEFRIGRTIGEGAFSKVKLAINRLTGEKVAIKIIKKAEGINKNSLSDVADTSLSSLLPKEVKILMRLCHPNVIALLQVIDTPAELFIVMEYASGGELIDYIAGKRFLPEPEARRLFRQLVAALDHCHLAGVVHRDLKLENVLMNHDKNLLLSDFGLGRTIKGDAQYLSTFCGTPLYAAPELVSGIHYVGTSADIWSLGIVLYIMTAGKPPFRCDTISELYAQIKAVKYKCPEYFTPGLKAILGKILVKDPKKRITMDELRKDSWLNENFAELPLRVAPAYPVHQVGGVEDEDIEKLVSHTEKTEDFVAFHFTRAEGKDYVQSMHRTSFVSEDSASFVSERVMRPTTRSQPDPPYEAEVRGEIVNMAIDVPKSLGGASNTVLNKLKAAFGKNSAVSTDDDENQQSQTMPRERSRSMTANKTIINETVKMSNRPLAVKEVDHGRRHSVNIPKVALSRPVSPMAKTPTSNSPKISSPIAPSSSQNVSPATLITLGHMAAANKTDMPIMAKISENEEATTLPNSRKVQMRAKTHETPVQPSSTEARRRRPSLIESMGFHSHSGYSDEMRTVRFSSNIHTSAVFGPTEIASQIEVLVSNRRLLPNVTVEKRSKWVWALTSTAERSENEDKLIFEVEVVKVWLLKMTAVKMKRLGGDALEYKEQYDKIVSLLNW